MLKNISEAQRIHVTGELLFYVEGKEWVQAKYVKAGDEVLTSTGKIKVQSLKLILSGPKIRRAYTINKIKPTRFFERWNQFGFLKQLITTIEFKVFELIPSNTNPILELKHFLGLKQRWFVHHPMIFFFPLTYFNNFLQRIQSFFSE